MILHTLDSPAKVNFILEIKRKREDGFHELKTVMHSLDLADKLIFSSNKKGLFVKCSHPEVPENEQNLVYKAAIRLAEAYQVDPKITITIKKNIPVAAGMGGGSSNAATALLGLAHCWGINDNKEIISIARQLGSDVPFFLKGGCMLGIGRGERVFPWPAYPGIWIAVINPGINVSTAEVYKKFKLGLTRESSCISIMRRAIISKNIVKMGQNLFNHLAFVTERQYAVIGHIKEELLSLGATAAIMTGSGPTVFGILPSEKVAQLVRRKLKDYYPYVTITKTTGPRDDI